MKQVNRPLIVIPSLSLVLVLFVGISHIKVAGGDWYVAPYGSDSNTGTEQSPFLHINKALDWATYGDTIYLMGANQGGAGIGVFREEINRPTFGSNLPPFECSTSSKLMICKHPQAQEVIIKGSDLENGWQPTGGKQIILGSAFETLPSPTTISRLPKDQFGQDLGFTMYYLNWAKPFPPQQVIYTSSGESHYLNQVGWSAPSMYWAYSFDTNNQYYVKYNTDLRPPIRGSMEPGSFFYNEDEQFLYIRLPGDAVPEQDEIEVSVRKKIIYVTFPGLYIKDVVFEHSNTSVDGPGASVSIGLGPCSILESCTIRRTDFDGVGIGGCVGDSIVIDCDILDNGRTGSSFCGANCLFSGCRVLGNNYRLFNSAHHAGGMKVIAPGTDMAGSIIEHSEFGFNNGVGVWMDGVVNSSPLLIENNFIHDNSTGVFLELSEGFAISNNIVATNTAGVVLHGSRHASIAYNTVEIVCAGIDDDGNVAAIQMHARSGAPLTDNYVTNNIFVSWSPSTLVYLEKPNGDTVRNNIFDYNFYYNYLQPVRLLPYPDSRLTCSDESGFLPAAWTTAVQCDTHSFQQHFVGAYSELNDPLFRRNLAPPEARYMLHVRSTPNPVWGLVPVPCRFDYNGAWFCSETGRTEPGAFYLGSLLDSDNDKMPDVWDGDDFSPNRCLFASASSGTDESSGIFRYRINSYHGPKATINAALGLVTQEPGWALEVAAGTYHESVNLSSRPVTMTVAGSVSLGN